MGPPQTARPERVAVVVGRGDKPEMRLAAPPDWPDLLACSRAAVIPPTLVVADRASLNRLAAAARALKDDDARIAVSSVVDWWQQRAEHPGSPSVVILTEAASARYALADPDSEHSIGPWLAAFGITHGGPQGLLDLAEIVLAGESAQVDAREAMDSWKWVRRALDAGWGPRRGDTPVGAAIGLRSRCDAADRHAWELLSDPAWRAREHWSGVVVGGRVAGRPPGQVVVAVAQAACRHRVGSDVRVTFVSPGSRRETVLVDAEVADLAHSPDGSSVLVLAPHLPRRGRDELDRVRTGWFATVIPKAPDQSMAIRSRINLAKRYKTGNWVVKPKAARPPALHRDVPLDVLVAAATD
ncbi:MAG: hypothetical protein ACRD0J_13735 [Acidimicrobiales bacterium]